MTGERNTFRFCNCIRRDCWHPVGKCEEHPRYRGSTCRRCHDYNPERCPTCGRIIEASAGLNDN